MHTSHMIADIIYIYIYISCWQQNWPLINFIKCASFDELHNIWSIAQRTHNRIRVKVRITVGFRVKVRLGLGLHSWPNCKHNEIQCLMPDTPVEELVIRLSLTQNFFPIVRYSRYLPPWRLQSSSASVDDKHSHSVLQAIAKW